MVIRTEIVCARALMGIVKGKARMLRPIVVDIFLQALGERSEESADGK